MNEDLTEEQKHEVWLLACKFGIDTNRARALWEKERRAQQPQEPNAVSVETPLEPEENEEPEETTESEEDEEDTPEQIALWKKEAEEYFIREKKAKVLDLMLKQLEESEQQDKQATELLKEIADLKEKLESWRAILDNPRWEEILSTYFKICFAMTKGMCAKTVVTITEKDGVMNFSYDYFDANGAPIVTELSDGAKEALDKEKELD